MRGGHNWLIGALGIVGIALTAVAVNSEAGVPATVVGVAALACAWWLARLDAWQRLYALSLILLIAAASSFEAAASAAYYPRYLAVGTLVVWTWYGHRHEQVPLRSRPPALRCLVWGLHALVGLAAASTAWSYAPAVTAQQALALAMLAALIHLLATRRWTTPERIGNDLRVAYVILVVAATISLLGAQLSIAEMMGGFDRLQGVFANPNLLGLTMAVAAPLGWGVYRDTRRARYLLGLLPIILSAVESGSRTAQVAIAAAAAWLLLRAIWNPRYTALVVIGTGFAVVLGLLTVGPQQIAAVAPRWALLGGAEGTSGLNGRDLLWSAAIALWERKPVLGWGFAAGENVFTSRVGFVGFFTDQSGAHNSYLQLLLELGVVGAAVMLLLVGALLVAVIRSPLSSLNVGLIGVLVAGLVVQLTESAAFGTGQPYPYVYWLAAAGLLARQGCEQGAGRKAQREQREQPTGQNSNPLGFRAPSRP